MIDADGTQVGILPLRDAIKVAEARGLDLVEVSSTATPPVCRVTDFDKYRYAQKKKSHDSKKHTVSMIKEVKMGSATGQHDVDFKMNHIKRFVGEGHRVKLIGFVPGPRDYSSGTRTGVDRENHCDGDGYRAGGRHATDGRTQHVGAADAAIDRTENFRKRL